MLRAKYFSIAILFAFSRFCHMNIATYYIYLESCQDRFCYAVRGINISYNTENQDVSLVCAEPVSLDEEETLPRAIVEGATSYVPDEPQQYGLTPIQLCNDTNPLLLEHVQGDSHDVVVVVFHEDFDLAVLDKDYTNVNIVLFPHSVTINFQPNGSVNIIKPMWSKASEKTNLTFNETSSQCSVYEDANKRACICKENHARDHCLDRLRQKLDPSRKGYQCKFI
ncbi:hypothetical protein DdX_15510 [Ditylenchus destructor]|uniref:Uncharacterized protein n=1 Tax=Ditylenchus destructor TaxID=166010 RepID=A0AAD4MR83_9BILA|nr:hypothetical protein DdX_15510 [Ditylenchus destructor]